MPSRYISVRADNVPSSGKVSFKSGFPVVSFTIQSQNGILNPKSIRIAGNLAVFKDNATPPAPVLETDTGANRVTMDNRLGIYNVMDQLIIRHNKSKQICEHIRAYPRYLQSYLGLSSSKQDLMSFMGATNLIMPNPETFFKTVIGNVAGVTANEVVNSFSANLICGFLGTGEPINLMDTSFGGIQIEIHLSPDQACLFNPDGDSSVVSDAHYQLSELELTCEIEDIPADEMATLSKQSSGQREFNTITSLYTSINSTNAQLQFSLGLKEVQSVFMNFCPSSHINTITQNGNATTYPSKSGGELAFLKRIQWLRGGSKFPCEYDIVTNFDKDSNVAVVDPQVLKQFVDSVIPTYIDDRCSVSSQNNNRAYNLGTADDSYNDLADGGALFGLGMKYSQFNTGADFSREQWGVSIESDLTDDSPQSVFIYIKSRAVLVWSANGVQMIQ